MNNVASKEKGEIAADSLDFAGIGHQIAKARNRRGLTKQKAACGTGFSAQLLTKLEGNENFPSLTSLLAVANTLDVPVDTLFQDCHKDFLVFAIEDYLGRLDIKEADASLSILEGLMRGVE